MNSATANRTAQIPEQLDILNKMLDNATGTLSHLEDKLIPVMRPSGPAVNQGNKGGDTPSLGTPLAATLDAVNQQVGRLTARMNTLIDLIEL